MKRRTLVLAAVITAASAHAQQATLRVFSGDQGQRPDLMRKVFDEYEKANPAVKIQIETGGETSDAQSALLNRPATLLLEVIGFGT